MSNNLEYKNYKAVSKFNKWGIIDFNGRYLVEPIFINITSRYDEYFYFMLKNLIDVNLEILKSYDNCTLSYNYIVAYEYDKTDIFVIENKQIKNIKTFKKEK